MINKIFPGAATPSRTSNETQTQTELESTRPKVLRTGANHNLLFVVSNDQADVIPLQEHLTEQGILDTQRIIHVADPKQLPQSVRDNLKSQSPTTTINNIGIISFREDGDLANFIIPELTEIIGTIKGRVKGIYLAAKDAIPFHLLSTGVSKLLQRLSVDESSKSPSLNERIKEFAQLVLHGKPQAPKPAPQPATLDLHSVQGYTSKASPSEVLRGSTQWSTQVLAEALAQQKQKPKVTSYRRYLDPEEVQNSIFQPNTLNLSLKKVNAFDPFVDKVFQLTS